MSGLIKQTVQVAAGTTNANIISGEPFETLTRPGLVRLIINYDSGGGVPEVDFTLGNTVVAQRLTPNIAATAGTTDRQVDSLPPAAGAANDRVVIRVRETGGVSAVDVNFQLEISDVA